MPTFHRFGSRKGSASTAQPSPDVALPATKIKTPYWASTEVNPSAPTTTPAAPTIQRKPVGASANAGTQPQQPISPPARSVQRKPVPTSPSPQPTWRYNPVEGNPYRPGPRRDSIQYGLYLAQPEASTQPAAEANRRTYSPPHWATAEEIENLHDPRVAARCQARINARNASEEHERPLSPGSIFANGGVPVAPERKTSKASKVFSRSIGGVKKAAEQAKRALSVSHEPKVSSPVPGSFRRGNEGRVMQQQEGVAPIEVVDLEVAQGDVQRYGRVDLQPFNPQIAGPRAEAWALLTGEPIPAQSPRMSPAAVPMPSAPAHPPRTSSRKPPPVATPRPRPAAPVPAPAHPAVPAVPAATKSKQNPCMVLGEDGRETLFGDFVDLANNSSWVKDVQGNASEEARYEGKGKGRAAPTSTSDAPSTAPTMAPKPLKVRKQPVVDKSLPPTPPEQLPTRHNTLRTLQETALPAETPNNQPVAAPSLAAALAAEGVRPTSYVPGIKCSDCGKMIDVVSVGDHRCGKRAAQAVDHERQPTGPSREEVYAANFRGGYSTGPAELVGQDGIYGFLDSDNEPNVVVDTFMHSGHTSWKGIVRAEDGASTESLVGKLSGGVEGIRLSNEADRANGSYKKSSGYG